MQLFGLDPTNSAVVQPGGQAHTHLVGFT